MCSWQILPKATSSSYLGPPHRTAASKVQPLRRMGLACDYGSRDKLDRWKFRDTCLGREAKSGRKRSSRRSTSILIFLLRTGTIWTQRNEMAWCTWLVSGAPAGFWSSWKHGKTTRCRIRIRTSPPQSIVLAGFQHRRMIRQMHRRQLECSSQASRLRKHCPG